MQDKHNDSALRLIVTATSRDGRRRYDRQSKHDLAKACLRPGVSLAGMALEHGVNANLLRKWVISYQKGSDAVATAVAGTIKGRTDAFVPVVLGKSSTTQTDASRRAASSAVVISPTRLRVQLPNGITLEFECTGRDADLVSTVIQTLGRCNVPSRR